MNKSAPRRPRVSKMRHAEIEAGLDPEADRVLADALAMSDEDLDKDLREHGVDVEALEKRAAKLAERFNAQLAKESQAKVAPPAPESAPDGEGAPSAVVVPIGARKSEARSAAERKMMIAYAAAAAVATAGVATYLATRPKPEPPPELPKPDGGAVTPVKPDAKALRAEAAKAFAAKDWERCVELLDEAEGIDPAGALDKDVAAMKSRAVHERESKGGR